MAIASWQLVRVYGTWVDADGVRLGGTYTISVTRRLTNATDDLIIPAGVFKTGALSTGSVSLDVMTPATDDVDIEQTGWPIRVDVSFTDTARVPETYLIAVPYANRPAINGGNGLGVNLRTLPVVAEVAPAVAAYGVGIPGGLAKLSSDGQSVLDSDGDPIRTALNAKDYGVVGNGTADDSTALQSLITTAASLGLVAMLAPASTVRCVSAITLPSGTRLDLNGATLKNASASTSGRLLNIVSATDVWVGNGTLDGDKAGFATATEQRHNLRLVNSARVTIENVLSKNAKGDGIYIGDDATGICSDVTLMNFRADGNHRNGGSVTGVKGFRQFGGYYRNSGGTGPDAGFDVEPNTGSVECSDGAFYGVCFDANRGTGLLVQAHSAAPTARQSGWRFYGCTANGNGLGAIVDHGHGISLRWATNLIWDGGEIRDNLRRGVYFRDALENININADVVGNLQGGYAQPADSTITGLRIAGLVANNGSSGTYDGVDLAGAGSRLAFAAASTGNTRYGLRTLGTWSAVSIGVGAVFTGNTTGTVSLGDVPASRTVTALGIAGGVVPVGRSSTALRPAATDVSYGLWLDTTLNKIIWSNGGTWRDTMGNSV